MDYPDYIDTSSYFENWNKTEEPDFNIPEDFSFLSDQESEQEYLDMSYDRTIPMGLKTGYDDLDEKYRFKRAELNTVIGFDNVGKTYFLLQLAVISNIYHDWKWLLYASENDDAKVRKELIQIKYGKMYFNLTREEREKAHQWVYQNFDIIKSIPEDFKLETFNTLMGKILKAKEKKNYDSILIDPYNSLQVDISDGMMTTHDYHYSVLSKLRIFCKKYDIAAYINAHPNTNAQRTKNSSKNSKAPSKSDTEGGAKFPNRSDNVIVLHRRIYDKECQNVLEVHIAKIKDKETGGNVTYFDEPIKLTLEHRNGWFGYYNNEGVCSIKSWSQLYSGDIEKDFDLIKDKHKIRSVNQGKIDLFANQGNHDFK